MSRDALAVLRGIKMVANAAIKQNTNYCKHLLANSSVREVIEEKVNESAENIKQAAENPARELQNLQKTVQETTERCSVVLEGLRQMAGAKAGKVDFTKSGSGSDSSDNDGAATKQSTTTATTKDTDNLDISSITLRELEEILAKRSKDRKFSLRTASTESKQIPEQQLKDNKSMETPKATPTTAADDKHLKVSAVAASRHYAKQVPYKDVKVLPVTEPAPEQLSADTVYVQNIMKMIASTPQNNTTVLAGNASVSAPQLSVVAKQRSVPSSRIGRMASFGSLFAGLGFGTINELSKGMLGLGGSKSIKEALLSPANAERIVDTLCKVRGAALKIGQILSIQDSTVVSPQLAKAFERVRQAADYMPDWQVERVMSGELGSDWREKLKSFDDKPFAAASIGQVHRATLKNDMQVAIKIQYPGVAKSIESDIDNLVGMLKVWNVFPQGFFIDNVVKVAKRELTLEVDYNREAEYTNRFKEMLTAYPEYYVPTVIKDLTTTSVLTTELVPGVPLDKCFDLSYDHRLHIAESVMKLCLRELFELQCMQTDPNWSNFLYDEKTRRLMLIDFGSARFYQKNFTKGYRSIIMHAAENNRQGVLEMSRTMGFLTGYETKQMEEAHVDAVMILGETFRGEFDFGKQNVTKRIAHLVPTMVAHRLCPPPEEIYSIHRKLSGIFLLCTRLNVKMNCRAFYDEIVIGKFKE